MKVIDLLNKIANGEEVPKKIKWEDIIYAYSEYDKDYLEYPFSDEEYKGLFDMRDSILTQFLNEEVEILEEEKKIPEKLKNYYDENLEEYVVETYINGIKYQEIFNSRYDEMIISKINEVLDYLESKGE